MADYKGIDLNAPGDPEPWGGDEEDNFKEIIDSIAIGTVEGSLVGAKTIGHRHPDLYSKSTGLLSVEVTSDQKTTVKSDLTVDGDVVVTNMTSEGFVKNDGSGNITGGNPSIDANDQQLINNGIITGWLDPVKLDVNVDPTKFDITEEGEGIFIDKSTTPFTIVRKVIVTQTAVVANLGLSGREVHIFFDKDGMIIQTNSVSSGDLIDWVYAGNFTKNGAGTEISFELNQDPTADSMIELFRQFIFIIGGVSVIPIIYSGVTSTLQNNRSSGEVIRPGISANTDRKQPDNKVVIALSPVLSLSLRYVDENGEINFFANGNVLDPTSFYNKSTMAVETVITSKFTAQRVYYFASSNNANETNMVLLGHVEFSSIADAEAAINTAAEEFVKPAALRRAVFCGWWILKGNATDAMDIAEAKFVPYTSPFEISGGSSGSVFNSGAAGSNKEIQINTSGSLDADPSFAYDKALVQLTVADIPNSNSVVTLSNVNKSTTLYTDTANTLEVGSSSNIPVITGNSSSNLVITNAGAGEVEISGAPILTAGDGTLVLSDNGTYVPVTGGTTTSFSYRFQTATTPPPDSGRVRYDNVTQLSATLMYVHKDTNNSEDIHNFLANVSAGDRLVIMNSSDSGQFQEWRVTAVTDVTTYIQYAITLLSSQGSSLSNNQNIILGLLGVSKNSILMQDTYNNSAQPQVLTSDSKSAVQFKRGTTGGDTDNVIEVLNGSGDVGFAVEGHGNVRIEQGATDTDAVIYLKGSSATKGGIIVAENSTGAAGSLDIFTGSANRRLRVDKDNGSLEIGTGTDSIKLFPLTNDGIGPTPVPSQDLIFTTEKWQMGVDNSDRDVMRFGPKASPVAAGMSLILGERGVDPTDNGSITLHAGEVFIQNATDGLIDLFSLTGGGGGGASVFAQFAADKTGTQTMNNGVEVVVNWENENYDDDGILNLTTDIATVVTAGMYVIAASVKASVAASGQIETYLYINGSKYTTASGSIDTAGTMVANLCVPIRLAASDTIQIKSAQFSGFTGTMQVAETVFNVFAITE